MHSERLSDTQWDPEKMVDPFAVPDYPDVMARLAAFLDDTSLCLFCSISVCIEVICGYKTCGSSHEKRKRHLKHFESVHRPEAVYSCAPSFEIQE
jgi:hypothetical protein